MSIKRLVQLVLDKASAKKVEKGTQKSLDKGTDPKKAKRNLGQVGGALNKLKAIAIKVGAVLGGIWVVRKVAQYGKAIFKLGSDVQAVRSQFETVFGGATSVVDEFVDDFRRMAGLTSRDAQRIAARSGGMAKGFGLGEDAAADFAEQVLRLSGDLASFNNVPTAEAAQLVQSALIGNTEAARSLNVAFTAADVKARALAQTGKASADSLTQAEKAMAALSVMAERAGPQIGDLARTQDDADNQAKQLAASWQQLKNGLASALTGGTSGTGVFGDARDLLEELTRFVVENRAEISKWARVLVLSVKAVVVHVAQGVRGIKNLFDLVAGGIVLATRSAQEAVARVVDVLAKGVNATIRGLNRLPGVDIDFRMGGMDVEHFARMREAATEGLVRDARQWKEGLDTVVGAWGDVVRAAGAAEEAQKDAVAAGSPSPGGPGGPGGPRTSAGGVETGLAGADRALQGMGLEGLRTEAQVTQTVADEVLDEVQQRAERTAQGMTRAFEGFFRASQDGFEATGGVMGALGDAAQGVGASIVAGLAEGQAEYHMAQAIGKLAEGLWPPNPAAIASAAKHSAAAAAFTAMPGLVGGGGGVGGGARIPTGAGGVSRIREERTTRPAEVNIFIDPLSPSDPAAQRFVHGAAQNARERFGENVKVNVRPRSGA